MAAQGVLVTHANQATPNIGDLFAGKCFLVAQRVPMRTNFLDRIRANGGRIVRLESQADYIIADHARKDCPPTSLSYTFIEAAISAGALPDPDHHRAGPAPGAVRAVGSTVVPPKATRTAFTPQDDRDLWMWVQNYQSLGLHGIKGNEIYKQLEAINPRHTYQSWRDRYVKRLMAKPPQGVPLPQNVTFPQLQPASSQVRQPGLDGTVEEEAQEEEDNEEEFGPDVKFLLENIDDILNIPTEDLDTVWASLADEEMSSHLTADQWKRLYEEEALPAYEARQKKEKRVQTLPLKRKARLSTPEPPALDVEPTTPELVAMRAKAARDREASPSVSQKRRLETDTPRGHDQGRKRTKANHSDSIMKERPTGDELEDLQRSTANQQHVLELGLSSENMNGDDPNEPALPGEEPSPPSVLDQAAKTRLTAETDLSDVESELQSQQHGQNGTQDGIGSPNPLKLTRENLAHQQAQHDTKSARAYDLHENDENLTSYADYLQKLVTGHIARRTGQLQGERSRNLAEPGTELEADRESNPVSEVQTTSKALRNGKDGVPAIQVGNPPVQVEPSNNESDGIFGPDGLVHAAETNGSLPDFAEGDDGKIDHLDSSTSVNAKTDKLSLKNQAIADPNQQSADEEMTENVGIDLTLAEPEGRFDFSSQVEAQPEGLPNQHKWEPKQPSVSSQNNENGALIVQDTANISEGEEMEEAPAKAIAPGARAVLDTQDIYATGVQQPDFSFPLPPDSDADESQTELPTDPAPAQQTTPRPTTSSPKRTASATPRKLTQLSTHKEPEASKTESVEAFLARLTAAGCDPASLHSAVYRTSAQLQAAEVVAMYDKLGLPVPDIPELWSAEDDAKVGTTDAKVFKALCEKKGWEEYDLRLKFLQHWKAGQ